MMVKTSYPTETQKITYKMGRLSRYFKIRELTRARISTHWVWKKCIEFRAYIKIRKISGSVD